MAEFILTDSLTETGRALALGGMSGGGRRRARAGVIMSGVLGRRKGVVQRSTLKGRAGTRQVAGPSGCNLAYLRVQEWQVYSREQEL
eukprot:2856249-Rhodomonas_salina.1